MPKPFFFFSLSLFFLYFLFFSSIYQVYATKEKAYTHKQHWNLPFSILWQLHQAYYVYNK